MKPIYFNQPYQLFFGCIPLICLLATILPVKAVDIQFHDTYFVFALTHLAIPISILLAGIGTLYWLFRQKEMIDGITLFHTVLTILPVLLLFIWVGFSSENAVSNDIEEETIGLYWLYLIAILLFLLGQILFLVNLLIALFKE